MGSIGGDAGFAGRLMELGGWLVEHDLLWRSRPFIGLPVAWEADFPEVSRALRGLPEDVIEEFEPRPEELPGMPADFRRWADEAARFAARPLLDRAAPLPQERQPQHVKGRKWRQVVPFVRTVLAHRGPEVVRWVDWCSGKGHLGRTLSEITGLPVTFVERQRLLCRDGRELVGSKAGEARFVEADVLDAGVSSALDELLEPGVGAVALHACGQLHRELLVRANRRDLSFLAVAPCCHHATRIDPFVPLSRAAREVPLRLGNHQLRLVGLHEAVATARRQLLRRREQAWRLALDLLLRERTGHDVYRPLGPVAKSWLRSSFPEFSRRLLDRAGLALPEGVDWDRAWAVGRERLRLVRALGMVRGLFRGPLEAWLLLDQSQFLREQGWEVKLGSFCDPSVTPRNGLIVAVRPG